MSRFMRFYTYGLLGAIGGLFAWQASNLMGLSFTSNLFLSEAIVGAIMGLLIGFFIGLAEGVATQSILFGIRKSLLSALLGALGGAIALPLAEGVFLFVGGQAWTRPIGWAIFGGRLAWELSLLNKTNPLDIRWVDFFKKKLG